ncbi:BES1-interacting Myc-like protein 2 [Prunus dulcis]|uniref:BES1-interacting Myc-like protein 2 n=1 Tax=Prunus dulcis TaxID=3755 RepID=A0A4Y1R7W2_PRUDU|nr:BES1-interacting Myc-like protein 2 [Prunus dulcis]
MNLKTMMKSLMETKWGLTNCHNIPTGKEEKKKRVQGGKGGLMLRDLIPKNDQKRDKASFLLEVIEYIQFLQEKKNHNRPGENFVDQSQVMNNGSGHENNAVVSPAMLPNTQNSVESDLGSGVVYKALDHIPGLATRSVPNVQQQNIFDPIGSVGLPTQPLQESISDAENMTSNPPYQLWQGITSTTASDDKLKKQDENSGSGSISSAYSQGVLNNLTQALQSSGVDLSQASISVQINVGSRVDSGLTSMASSSKVGLESSTVALNPILNVTAASATDAQLNQSLNNQMTQTQVSSCDEDFEPAHKRFRTGES